MSLLSPSLPIRGAVPNPTTYWSIGEVHWYKSETKIEIIMYGFLSRTHRLTGLYNKIDTKGFFFGTGDVQSIDLPTMYYLIKTTPEFSDAVSDEQSNENDIP